MNTVVEKLVRSLFDQMEMTPELYALRDQMMAECQSLFGRMAVLGVNEGKAIQEVKQHLEKRRAELGLCAGRDHADAADEAVYQAAGLRYLDVDILHEDLCITPSEDEAVHIVYDRKHAPMLYAAVEGCVLLVRSEEPKVKPGPNRPRQNAVPQEAAGAAEPVQIQIRIPADLSLEGRLRSTSGNLEVNGIRLVQATVESDSGEICVHLAPGVSGDGIRCSGSVKA